MRRGILRNFIFGAEDSLVSTVGLLSGVSFAGLNSRSVILSGVILILVEALSMAAGVYIAEDSTNELEPKSRQDNQLSDGVVMFFTYLLIGLIPLLPYFYAEDTRAGFYWSIGFSLAAMLAIGIFKGLIVGRHILKSALKVVAIGGTVTVIAIIVGLLISI